MLLLVKQIHLPSETLVHIEGEWRGGEKREGKLLFIWGERGVCAKFCLILVTKQEKKGKQDCLWFKPTRYTRPDKHSDPAAVSWIDQIKEMSERNQSLLKQNELEACERAGGIMRGEERRRGDIKQEGLLRQEGAAGGAKIMAPSLDGWRTEERRRGWAWKKKRKRETRLIRCNGDSLEGGRKLVTRRFHWANSQESLASSHWILES